MKKLIQKLLVIILITQFMVPISVAHAEVLTFPALNMELNIPKETIILTMDTPIADETWKLAGINDPISEIKTMKQMGVKAILFDSITKTRVSILSKQTQQSEEIFHLSSLSEEELNNFLSNIIEQDANTTCQVEKYLQKETTFFRLYIETLQNNLKYKELVYGSIVNGSIISFHIYQDKAEATMNESYVKSLVDGVHFTKYFDKTEINEQEQFATTFRTVSTVVLLITLVAWILLLRKRKQKYNALAKRRAEEISKFYSKKKETGDTKSTILFHNRSEYSKKVFQTFFLYHEVISKTKQWIILSALCIVTFILFHMAGSGLLSYLQIVALILILVYIKKVSIEKQVNREIKFFNLSERLEMKFQFFEDYLSMGGNSQTTKYPYLQIIKVREYKNYIYLYLDINKAIYLNKDGFDPKAEDFITFIKQKQK